MRDAIEQCRRCATLNSPHDRLDVDSLQLARISLHAPGGERESRALDQQEQGPRARLEQQHDDDVDSSEEEDDDYEDTEDEDEGNLPSDDDDDAEYLAERNFICRLARPLYPDQDIRVRVVSDMDLAFTAVVQVKITNDALMNGEEKRTEVAAYRDLFEMVKEERLRRGLSAF
ncbi:hypothetical protein AAFC00_005090 [Neodothiora populina]|uniref:Uncharacterized protein n=1 Tax=Neodothiora populina TaxID=2781224 RepID=A0ABR3PKU4_9PEZI